jgi:molybdate transport system substrate-binding protein
LYDDFSPRKLIQRFWAFQQAYDKKGELLKNLSPNKILWRMLLTTGLIALLLVTTSCSTANSTVTTTTNTTSTTTTTTDPVTLNVSAASSLSNVLKAIDALYTKSNPNVTISLNTGASGTLQTQIENGAPADVFLSAASANMDTLQNENLIINSSRKNLLNNTLVMIVPVGSTLGLTSFNDLTLAKVTKIAIGDPKSVPAGAYAQAAFNELGITSQIQSKFILGANVTQVLTYVAGGNVDVGFVYSTDALSSTQVKVVANAPADINAQIIYPAAILKASTHSTAAQAYLDFLSSDQAKALFIPYGFTMAAK